MKICVLSLFLICAIFTSCSKYEAYTPDMLLEAPIITGYKLIDIYGMPMGLVGMPNIKTEIKDEGTYYKLSVFPIPAQYRVTLVIDAPNDGIERQI
jgi:hypothetical protein